MIKKILRNTSGNVAVTAAMLAFPLLAATGAAIDFARLNSMKSQYQQAADAAVLAATAQHRISDSKRKKIADQVFLANLKGSTNKDVGKLVILDDGFRYEAKADVALFMMHTVGIIDPKVDVVAEVGKAVKNVEIALVLDTTGSMEPHMTAMKNGAKSFVDTIETASGGTAKFAVVPFVAAVNVGRRLSNNELDRNGDSQHHASFHENKNIYFEDGATCGSPAPPDGNSTQEGASLGGFLRELLGINSAHAQTTGAFIGSFPSGWTSTGPCNYVSPPKLNHFDFYTDMGQRWKGCVEARPGDLDVSNDPATGDPNTKWVPYFWPDEETRGTPVMTHNHYFGSGYGNVKPVPDLLPFNFAWTMDPMKYQSTFSFDVDNSAPTTLGPNKACPDEVLPLNADMSIVRSKIDSLSHWNDGGTIASEGVAWGMRMLTPEAPFRQGAPVSEEIHKVLVLFGDGRNEMPINIDNSPMITDYGAYGYGGESNVASRGFMASVYPMESGSARMAEIQKQTQAMLDERMRLACDNAKDEDITVLTILFNETDAATQAVYRDCATDTDGALVASNTAGLDAAFDAIANKILRIYLRK